MLIGDLGTKIDLDNSNQAPFTFAHGWPTSRHDRWAAACWPA